MNKSYRWYVFIIVFCAPFFLCRVAAQSLLLDSAKQVFVQQQGNDSLYVRTCFFIADNYMDIEQYDSAQIWLNKIHNKLPVKKSSLFNYFLITRQAEVYYYNNLQQLGLQESFKGLRVAKDLNDSLLLADSYNFLGLFYMNIDSSEKAIVFYKNGLQFTRQPPYPLQYFSLSKPHHLYGNMSEAYYKLGRYDSALINIRLSLQKASEIDWGRGIAVGHTSAGDIFFATNSMDSALYNYQLGKQAAKNSKDIDVELLCYGGVAKCLNAVNKYQEAKKYLDTAFSILKTNPTLNRFFALQFLSAATAIYKQRNDPAMMARALEIKSHIEAENVKSNSAQIQTILNAGVENEKRLLSMEVIDAQQKQNLANTRLIVVIVAFALLLVAFFWYRYFQKQKMQLANVRQKISQDLHDDIGASLSSLQIYGAIAEKTIGNDPGKAIEMVQKISRQSKSVMENMNDIVWSMRSASGTGITLEAKIKNFAVELLQDKDIHFSCDIAAETETVLQSMQARKNILLIIKESINNIAKHSKATEATLQLGVKDKQLHLIIADNGKGFENTAAKRGNGLDNMKMRTEELKGSFEMTSSGNGTSINITIPLAIANNKGW
ncbi:tetratricopeptide repeat-containing sensor histidine kinase [Ferruginibacter sp.]